MIVGAILLLVVYSSLVTADPPGTQYVIPSSVNCSSEGITFSFSTNSDLFTETGLNVTLFTGSSGQQVTGYAPQSQVVTISYDDYSISATTVFGPNARPLLYNIEQPFYAVPEPYVTHSHRSNYTFGVYCTIVAYDNVHLDTNTTDDGHGDHGGQVTNPADYVKNQLFSSTPGKTVTIGDALQYSIVLDQSVYSALVPVTCNYYDPQNDKQVLPIVSDKCPRVFPDDPDGYFGTMKQVNSSAYELDFRAFSFDGAAESFVGIECDIQLCIHGQEAQCNPACWGTQTTAAAETTTSESGPTETTTSTLGPDTTTSTLGPDTTTSTSTPPTTTTTLGPETKSTVPPAPLRMNMKYHSVVKRAAPDMDDAPQTTTVNEKAVMKVNLPGVTPEDSPTQVCTDSSLLSALYAVIGVLAILVAIMVGTLGYIACKRRQTKTDYHDRIHDGPFVKSVMH